MAVVKATTRDWRNYGVTGYDPDYGVYQLPSGGPLGTYQPYGSAEAEYFATGSAPEAVKTGTRDFGSLGIKTISQAAGGGTKASTTPRGSITQGAAAQPIGTIATRKTTYEGEMPSLDLREMDKRRVKALTQKALAPRLRHLRSALQRALVRSYENPNVRRMVVRAALEGYGQGLEEARAGAEQFALKEEATERATENQELVAAYNAAMQKYMAGATVTQTSRQIYGGTQAAATEGLEGPGAMSATKGRYSEQQAARTGKRIVGGRLI